MPRRRRWCVVLGFVVLAGMAPPADVGPAERRFDALLTAARKDPAKADWKALRHAFAETTYYQPYSTGPLDELNEARTKFKNGDFKGAEDLLVKLRDREHAMRLDTHLLLGAVYDRSGQKDKEGAERGYIEGILGSIFVPGNGFSYEKPIEVLFIEEEYFFVGALGIKAKRQGLSEHDGHRFDVYKVEAQEGRPEHQLYFNVDLPQKSLGRMLKGLEKPKDKA